MTDVDSRPVAGDDDLIIFDDVGSQRPEAPREGLTWTILVVDDDDDVHAATDFALRDVLILERSLRLLHARSAESARAVLLVEPDVAVILLDVVMETQDAGFRLVKEIRGPMRRAATRIILRTGQPADAPEIDAIREHDINDYKTKSELTHTRLYAALTTAVRSYQQLRAVEASRQGLARVVRGMSDLMGRRTVLDYARGLLEHLAALLEVEPHGLICTVLDPDGPDSSVRILSRSGRFSRHEHSAQPASRTVQDAIRRVSFERRTVFEEDWTAVPLSTDHPPMVVYLETPRVPDEMSRQIVDVFCRGAAVGVENVSLMERLKTAAYTDTLSGLTNRVGMVICIDQQLQTPQRADLVLVLVDLDLFAEVNDALGHRYGDRLLVAVAERLRARVGVNGWVGRFSGDVFAVLGAAPFVGPEQVREMLRVPLVVDSTDVHISVTMGVVRLDHVDGDGSDALKEASIALQRAKAKRRGDHAYFTREMATDIRKRVDIVRSLRDAIDSKEFHLVFQPQWRLLDAQITGFEALIRWRNRQGEVIPPDQFIPLAERSGLIVPIGDWVIEEACRSFAALGARGYNNLRMSVNVSMSQFRQPDFVEMVTNHLAAHAIPTRSFELEITESMAMEDFGTVVTRLNQIREAGCSVAIDDFGMGFSSLSHLQTLPVDRLKIDRMFVNTVTDDPRGSSIARTVVQLGRTLGLSVVAEGIETEKQRLALEQMWCHEGQGYLVARPMVLETLLSWLRDHTTGQFA